MVPSDPAVSYLWQQLDRTRPWRDLPESMVLVISAIWLEARKGLPSDRAVALYDEIVHHLERAKTHGGVHAYFGAMAPAAKQHVRDLLKELYRLTGGARGA